MNLVPENREALLALTRVRVYLVIAIRAGERTESVLGDSD